MPSPLSSDLRQRVVVFMEAGASCQQAADRFGVSASSASRWAARKRAEGHVAPKPMGGARQSHRLEAHAPAILALCRRKPTVFLREVRDHLAQRGMQTSTTSLFRFFSRHGISREKGTSMRPSRTGRT